MSLKRNIKVLGLALAAVFAFSALAAVAAQANSPRWTTGGGAVTLADGATKNFEAESTGHVSLTFGGLKLTTNGGGVKGECKATGKIVGSGSVKEKPGKVKESTLICHNVDVFSHPANANLTPNCTVHSPGEPSGTVKTNELEGTLVWTAATGTNSVGVTFVPEANTTTGAFATIEITGELCAVSQKVNVTGSAIGTIEEPNKDLTEGKLSFVNPADLTYWTNQTPSRTKDTDPGLKVGTVAATFEGTFDVQLNPCELWGVEGV